MRAFIFHHTLQKAASRDFHLHGDYQGTGNSHGKEKDRLEKLLKVLRFLRFLISKNDLHYSLYIAHYTLFFLATGYLLLVVSCLDR